MRDVSNLRKEFDRLRVEIVNAYCGPVYDPDRAALAAAELRLLLKESPMALEFAAPIEDVSPKREAVWPPRPECVVAAIRAACEETGAGAQDVIDGVTDIKNKEYPVARARAYAALALRAVFEESRSSHAIGRLVGSKSPLSYMATLDNRIKSDDLKWFDNAVFMRVIAKTEEAI